MTGATDRKPRGELAELAASIQSLLTAGKRTDKELRSSKRDVFKKIISLVSVGMDMSSLFPSMISCANLSSDDLVLKKMLYLYITHYATQVPDIALLAINQLHKDCRDQDPTVRGLALRSLCSLRVGNFLEYVTDPVNVGLEDRHPYVRRTAVLGVLKIYHIDANVVIAQGMLDKVRRILHTDPDAQVLANCLTVLMQLDDAKVLASDKSLLYSLINRIKDFSDWSQCQVLELVSHYTPSSESEVFDFLNALEDRMAHANSAVVMSAIKAFLHLTLSMTATHQQVLERIKDPLKTLISREDPSTTYAVLSHVLLLLQRAPIIFEQEYQAFYCRTHDPWYIKKLKMESLAAIASAANVYEIVNELTEYARDINPAMAREAVRAVGRIALTVPDVTGIIERLLLFLDTGSEHLTAEALVQMKDLLRRYPDVAQACLPQLNELSVSSITQPEARAALIWIVGQFGQHIQGAPYLLESIAEGQAQEEPCVRLALLTAAAQLFFKRPPECRALLGSLLAAGLNDSHQDVHDRALLYYRLLRHNVAEAERILNPPLLEVKAFSEGMTEEMKDVIFREFNTLSVVFQAPSSTFVERKGYHDEAEAGEVPITVAAAEDQPDLLGDVDNATTLLPESEKIERDLLDLDINRGPSASTSGGGAPPWYQVPAPMPAAAAGAGAAGAGPLDLGSLLGGDFGTVPAAASSVPAVPAAAAASTAQYLDDLLGGVGAGPGSAQQQQQQVTLDLRLNPQARVTSAQFQDQWKALAPAHQYSDRLSRETVSALSANSHKDFSQHMAQAYIMTMASGGQPPMFKYYFYGQVAGTGTLIMVEMVVRTDSLNASITMKTEATELLPQFIELWSNCLMGFYR